MSDTEDNYLTLHDIKKNKKQKKELNPEVKQKRADNMRLALEARRKKYQERQQMKLVESNLKDLLIEDPKENIIDNKDVIDELNEKLKPQLKKDIKIDNNNTNTNTNNNELIEMVKHMNKRLDKLYTLKKMKINQPKKEIQPIIIDNNKNEKSLSLLESIRNKMINQY
jgi:flagellar hook-basal body complex protein FliE